ncbi:hypothetical protein J3A83DRAFT_4357577 [Scleroderma citrinum]
MQPEDGSKKDVIVVGAGVVGLSTAITIQERGGYRVTIVAETLPTDPRTIHYTSHWAVSSRSSNFTSRSTGIQGSTPLTFTEVDRETFERMWNDSEPDGPLSGCFFRHTHTDFRGDDVDPTEWLGYMPDFRTVPQNELVPGSTHGWSFTTFSLHPSVYLNCLLGRFLTNGGTVVRARLQHISQAIQGGITALPQQPNGVIVCIGLGARFLGGIEDKDIFPIRGQTIVLKAPWVKYGRTLSSVDGLCSYIMPRATGDVLIGGTKVANDWFPVPRKEDRDDILTRVLALCPELAPPDVRAERTPTIDDLRFLIIDEGCGFRPGRKGGVRLETEWFEGGGGTKIPVIYNYGHSGMGFQSSWGFASIVLRLLEDALKNCESRDTRED